MNAVAYVVVVAIVLIFVFVVPVVYSKIAGREKSAKNITSKPEGVKEKIEPKESEALRPHIVVGFKKEWLLFLGVLTVLVAIVAIGELIDRVNKGTGIFRWEVFDVTFVFTSFVGGPLLFGAFNTKYVFNDAGITVKMKLYLLFFVVFKRDELIPWRDVFLVEYTINFHGESFDFYTDRGGIPIMMFFLENYQDALALAAKHVDESMFTVKARNRLKTMGLRPNA